MKIMQLFHQTDIRPERGVSQSPWHPFTFAVLALAVTCIIGMGGCKKQDEITRYQLPKSRSGLESLTAAPAPVKVKGITNRMVVAIALREDATWFFKINGPIKAVDANEETWQSFIADLKFGDDNNPVWDLSLIHI